MLKALGNGVCSISTKSRRYLDGELDANELEEQDEENGVATA